MRFRQINLRKLWLSLLLLVGVTAIAVPGIQEVMDGNVAKIGEQGYETLQEAVDDAYANMTGDVTITLTSDITANTVVRQKQGMNLTIDGGNNTITGQILIYGGGFYGTDVLNIKNIKFTGSTTDFVSGKDAFVEIPAPNSLPAPYAVSGLSDAHNITVSDCSFISTSSSLNVVGFRSNSGTQCENLNLSGITGTNLHSLAQITGTNGGSVIGCSVDNSDSFVNVNGGKGDFTISGNTFTSSVSDGYAIRENGESTANITLSDNTFSAYKSIQMGKNSATKGTIKVESGNYNGIIVMSTTSTGTVSITGGTFSQPVDEYITAAGYGSFGNADGTFTVKEGTAVAAIGDKKFETLETTFAAAQDGETIKLLADCAGNGIQVLPNRFTETGLTVDFDGHTYTVDGDLTGSTGTQTQAFQLQMNNKITFQNGTIYSEKAKFLVNNYSDLTLDGMTLTLKNANYSSGYTLSNNNGNVVINNSTINANPAGKFAFDVCRGGGGATTYKSVHVTVTGNSVINGDIEIDAKNGDASDGFGLMLQGGTHTGNIVLTANAKAAMEATPDKALIQKSDSYEQDAPTGFKWVSNGIGLSTLTPRDPVAKIGDEIYYSLADAVAAVPTNGTQTTITMIADETVADQKITIAKTQNVVLDLNGKTITATGGDTNNGFYFITNNGTLEVTDNSTDKDGKITYACANPNTGYSKEYVTLYNHGTLTLTAGTIENTGKYLSYAVNTSSNAWGTGDDKNCVFNMTGGKVLCPQGDQSLRVYQNCAATNSPVSKNTVNISGGYIDNGIFLDDYLYTTNQNLTNYTGENIDTKVNISGGTINGLIDLKIRHPFNTVVNITGGDFTNAKMWVRKVANEYANVCGEPTAPMVTISGGKFDFAGENTFGLAYEYATTTWTSYEKPYDISGGVFELAVPAEFCTEGYAPADNTDATTSEDYPYTVLELPDVAEIGDVKYKSLAKAVAAVPADGTATTITMIADETINVSGYAITIASGKNVVLDLNGHQVVGACETSGTSALIRNLGTLTIQDGSDTNKDGTGNGKLIAGADPTWTWDGSDNYAGSYASNLIRNEATLVVNSGLLLNVSTGSAAYAIDNYGNGSITINGGKVDAAKASAIRLFSPSGASITVNNGIIGGENNYMGIQAQNGSNANVSINGGTISGQYALYGTNSNGSVSISGGTFYGYVGMGSAYKDDISITGGAFNTWAGTWGNQTKFISGGIFKYDNLSEASLADGYILTDNTDPETKDAYPYTVKQGQFVAQIGTKKYETLEEAWNAVNDGETITLLANCAGNGLIAPQGKFTNGLTVDFGEFTYTVDGTTVGSTGTETLAFQLLKDNKITFKNGTIYSEKAKMLVQNYSDLTLEGMTLDGSALVGSGRYTLSNNNGNVVIDGSTIIAKEGDNYAFDVCRYSNYPSVNVTVKGESVINGDIEVSASGGDAKDGFSLMLESGTLNGDIVLAASAKTAMANSPEIAKVSKSNALTDIDAPADYKWVEDGEGVVTLKACEYVAQIEGGDKYESLEAAISAAPDGATVTLLANTSGNGIKVPQGKYSTGLTVDFGGFTYTVDGTTVGSTGTETQAFQLLKDNKITFKNGTIYSENAKMLVQNYSDLTLKGMTLDGSALVGSGRYTLSNNNGNVVIDGSTIIAKEGDNYAFDVCRYSNYPSVNVTVKGESVINGDIEVDAGAGDPKEGMFLTVEAGTINGNLRLTDGGATAITDNAEKAAVKKNNDVTLAAPADYKWKDNGDGTSTLVPCEYICAIGTTKYETLADAVAAAGTSATTITLLTEAATDGVISGDGVVVPSGSNITFDLNGLTYNVSGETVGSSGTKTSGFQLLKDSDITFKNGTLKATSPTAQMLIQNYSNLTLEDVNLDGTALSGWAYALSNNCGTINLTGSTSITAKSGGRAFDTCKFGSYAIPTVNINTTGVISGPIEATGGKLIIENGKFDVTWVTDNNYAAGDIQIKGGVFTAKVNEEYCAEGFVCTDNDDPTYKYTVKSMEDAGIFEFIDGIVNEKYLTYTTEKKATSVTYTRSFKDTQANKYQSWFIPFDYTITADDTNDFKFYKVYMVSYSGSATGGTIDNRENIYIFLEAVNAGTTLKANKPYIIKPKEDIEIGKKYVFKSENVKILPAPNDNVCHHTETSDTRYNFYGTYVEKLSPENSDREILAVNGGNICWVTLQGYVVPYRWYIKPAVNYSSDDYAKISFVFTEDGNTTSIENMPANVAEEIEGIYSANGVKQDNLMPGLNIIKYKNGKTKKIYK